MSVFEWIKSADKEKLSAFVFWVYNNGVSDGQAYSWDDFPGYFGGAVLDMESEEVIANFL